MRQNFFILLNAEYWWCMIICDIAHCILFCELSIRTNKPLTLSLSLKILIKFNQSEAVSITQHKMSNTRQINHPNQQQIK